MIKFDNKTISSVYFDGQVIEKIYKGTLKVYEGWRKLIANGVPPLVIYSKGEDLIDYKIFGDSIQNGTPTPNAPIEVESVGTKTSNLFDINSGFALNQEHAPTIIEGKNIIVPYSASNNMGAEFLQFIPIEENEVYTCKFDLIQGKVRILIRLYDETKQLITDSVSVSGFRFNAYYQGIYADVTESTVSFPSNVKYIRFCTVQMNNSAVVDNIYSNYQFVKGNVVPKYEPYGYKIPVKVSNDTEEITTNIYLDDPLRKIGDYADYIDFKNKKVVRTNNIMTDFKTGLYWMYNGNYFQCTPYINANATQRDKSLCNYFMYGNASNDYCFWIDSSGQGIRVRNKDYTDVESFINWLSSKDIYMIYQLATPTEETIELPNIPTLKGTTIIEVDTNIQPSNMEVVYKGKKVKINNVTNLEKTDVSIIEEKTVEEVEE